MEKRIKIISLLFIFLVLPFSVFSVSVGGTTNGGTSYCSTTNSGFLNLTGHNGSILNWELSTNGGLSWINIPNTNAVQTYFNLSQTTCYRAIVKDGSFPPDTSTIACINIYSPTVPGTLNGGGIYCTSPVSGTLTLSGSVGNILYWEYSTDGGAMWYSISNTTTTHNYSGITQTTQYRAVVQSGTCPQAVSNVDTVVVDGPIIAGIINGSGAVCAGNNSGTLTLTGNNAPVLGWLYSINSGSTWVPISNTSTTLSYSNLTQETWYRAIVGNSNCDDTTAIKTIMVDQGTVAGTISGGGVYCSPNVASGTLTLTGNVGGIIDWEYSVDGGTTWVKIANSTTTENYSSLLQTRLYRVRVQSGVCPVAYTNIDTVFADPETIAGTLTQDTTVCPVLNQGTLTLTGYVGNVLYWEYSTDNGLNWSIINNSSGTYMFSGLTQTTQYRVTVQSGRCSILTSNSITVTMFNVAPVTAGNDVSIVLGETVVLNGTGMGTPSWSPPTYLDDPNIFNPTASPTDTIEYILMVTDVNGCINVDTVNVFVSDTTTNETALVITNLFTPNGDGINDYWYIENIDKYKNVEVYVYNIYGNLVFSKKDYLNDWGGGQLPDGTYYYIIKSDDFEVIKGPLEILR
ncbi:MAG: gliding motility-associated C-terminal domain-containing protein [Vicingus serpentipes]|nr:gliding motility-associated C-terminal domain-containing protein [Vicingus serpentipes]